MYDIRKNVARPDISSDTQSKEATSDHSIHDLIVKLAEYAETTEDPCIQDVTGITDADTEIIRAVPLEFALKDAAYTALPRKIKTRVKTLLSQLYIQLEDNVLAYFYCQACTNAEQISPGTLLMSRTTLAHETHEDPIEGFGHGTITDDVEALGLDRMMHDMTLVHTRNYTCPNDECPTNDGTTKDAVMYKLRGSFQVQYACTICGYTWAFTTA